MNIESGHISLFSSNLQSDFGFVLLVSEIHRQLSNPREGKCNKTQTPEGKDSNHPLRPHADSVDLKSAKAGEENNKS